MHALRDDHLQNLEKKTYGLQREHWRLLLKTGCVRLMLKHLKIRLCHRRVRTLKAPPIELINEEMRLLWHLSIAILCDQISRNTFHGTPATYRFDGFSHCRGCASSYFWQATCGNTHEHRSDIRPMWRHCCSLKEPLSLFMWSGLTAIASNHRDRMKQFGRLCKRNVILVR